MNVEKGALKFVAPATVTRATNSKSSTKPTRKRSARTPSRWSPRARCRRPRTRAKTASRRNTSASRSPNGTASTRKPKRSRSTRPKPARKAGARWASTTKKGDSWFTGEKKGHLVHPAGDRRAAATLIYFMCAIHPWMQGKVKVLPRRQSSGTSGNVHTTPRLGRRAFLGALGGGALASCCRSRAAGRRAAPVRGRDPERGRRGAVPGAAADPAGADRRRDRDPDPRGRGADPARPQDQALDLRRQLSRARRSAAPPASGPRSPSTTSCRPGPASSRSTSTAATTAPSSTASPAA